MDYGKLKKKTTLHEFTRLHSLVLTVIYFRHLNFFTRTLLFVCSPALYAVTVSSFNSLYVSYLVAWNEECELDDSLPVHLFVSLFVHIVRFTFLN